MKVVGHDIQFDFIEMKPGLARRVDVGQIGDPKTLDETVGQDIDLRQGFDKRGELALVGRGVFAVERPECLGERLNVGEVLAMGLVLRIKLTDLERAEVRIDHA